MGIGKPDNLICQAQPQAQPIKCRRDSSELWPFGFFHFQGNLASLIKLPAMCKHQHSEMSDQAWTMRALIRREWSFKSRTWAVRNFSICTCNGWWFQNSRFKRCKTGLSAYTFDAFWHILCHIMCHLTHISYLSLKSNIIPGIWKSTYICIEKWWSFKYEQLS